MPAYNQYSESSLLLRIAEGDEAAFKTIYEQYWNTIYATALSYLKSTAWAEDIVQDIFLKLWIKREKLPGIEKFDAYLFIMARNELLNALGAGSMPAALPEKYEDRLPGNLLAPDSILHLKQLDDEIRKAVEQLPPQQRLVFRLTRQEGLSHEDIAQRLGIDKRTVGNHVTRALNNIRRHLKEHTEILLFLAWIIGKW